MRRHRRRSDRLRSASTSRKGLRAQVDGMSEALSLVLSYARLPKLSAWKRESVRRSVTKTTDDLTKEEAKPGSIMVLLAVEDIIEFRWLVWKQPVLGFPSTKVMQGLQDCNIRNMSTFVERGVDARVVEFAQIDSQVERDIWEALLPSIANTLALHDVVSAPEDLERLTATTCFLLSGSIDLVQ